MGAEIPFWERPDVVARFAGREPDQRLQILAGELPRPGEVRVLDLGPAGGRNTVFLAEMGFEVHALDASRAMAAETRRRLAAVRGEAEAGLRVGRGDMTRLPFRDAAFGLVVALGVFHCAGGRSEWDAALAETYRVLEPGGRLLVAVHTDETDLDGTGLVPVEGEPHVFLRGGGRVFLVDAATLDAEMERHGFRRQAVTETVRRPTGAGGVRVTANGYYAKPGGFASPGACAPRP